MCEIVYIYSSFVGEVLVGPEFVGGDEGDGVEDDHDDHGDGAVLNLCHHRRAQDQDATHDLAHAIGRGQVFRVEQILVDHKQ